MDSAQLYEKAFGFLTQGTNLDVEDASASNKKAAAAFFNEACRIFRLLAECEEDLTKKKLLNDQIVLYECRIAELTNDEVFDMFNESAAVDPTVSPGADAFSSGRSYINETATNTMPPTSISHSIPAMPGSNCKGTKVVHDADSLLLTALEIDEKLSAQRGISDTTNVKEMKEKCIAAYVNAADAYMVVLKSKEKAGMSVDGTATKISEILDRVDDLKKGKVTTYTSAEVLNTMLRKLPNVPILALGTASANYHDAVLPVHTVPPKLQPQSSAVQIHQGTVGNGNLSQRELQILKQSSFINNKIFQPWLPGEEKRETFRTKGPFCDPDGLLPLSAIQKTAGAVWLRPKEIMMLLAQNEMNQSEESRLQALSVIQAGQQEEAQRNRSNQKDVSDAGKEAAVASHSVSKPALNFVHNAVEVKKPTMLVDNAVSSARITQDLVSDCSFVCSLCITAAFEEKFHKQLITKVIFPQNGFNLPILNAYGKYIVKLNINGVPRKVVIDDRLPFDPVHQKLLCSCSKDPTEFWVSLVEKAYMKVNGGYDFPGSNSGIDLYALTGWIPEQIWFSEDAAQAAATKKSSRNSKGISV